MRTCFHTTVMVSRSVHVRDSNSYFACIVSVTGSTSSGAVCNADPHLIKQTSDGFIRGSSSPHTITGLKSPLPGRRSRKFRPKRKQSKVGVDAQVSGVAAEDAINVALQNNGGITSSGLNRPARPKRNVTDDAWHPCEVVPTPLLR